MDGCLFMHTYKVFRSEMRFSFLTSAKSWQKSVFWQWG